MNLASVNSNVLSHLMKGSILHEFGHALGAGHEHQSPFANIPWDRDAVYDYYARSPNEWSEEDVDHNILNVHDSETTQATTFDPDSIMLYYYPPELTLDGTGTNENTDLSATDKAWMAICYPFDTFEDMQFSTMEIRPWDEPQPRTEKLKSYYHKYDSAPPIVIGLTSLDISKASDIRVFANIRKATTEEFKVSLESWDDTKLYSASMTFLEMSPAFSYIQTGVYSAREDWSKAPQQKYSKRIKFERPFDSPPKVVTWLQSLHMDKNRHWRVRVYATNIDATGFTIHADTWEDSILYSAGVTWLAYPAEQPGVSSGRFDTDDVRSWKSPKAQNSDTKEFDTSFSKTPKVIMALDKLDYDHAKNLRVRLSMSSVTDSGITWHIQSWGDSIMYGAGASFFAWT